MSHTIDAKEIKLVCVNVRSLKGNFKSFEAFLKSRRSIYDIIICTETWYNAEKMHLVSLEGYVSLHASAGLNKSDGVSMYIKKGITFEEIPVITTVFSSLQIKLKAKNTEIRVMGIYRSPSRPTGIDFFQELGNSLVKGQNEMLVVTGDFNINLLATEAPTIELLDLLSGKGFISLINEPTRPNLKGEDTCLDHIYISKLSKDILVKGEVIKSKVADHYPVQLSIGTKIKCTAPGVDTNITVINYQEVAKNLSGKNWDSLYKITDTNVAIENLYKCLDETIRLNSCIRKKPACRDKILKPWITIGIVRSIQRRDKIFKLWSSDKSNEELRYKYLLYRNAIVKLIRNSKSNYYQKEIRKAKNDPRKYWCIINKLSGREKSRDCRIDVPPDELNDYFSTIGERLSDEVTKEYKKSSHKIAHQTHRAPKISFENSMFMYATNEDEIRAIIAKLKSNTSCGSDTVSVTLLKTCSFQLSKPLTYLSNLMIQTGVFPDKLKIAEVIPIYKGKGSQNDPSGYRPISLLSNIAKIMENVIKIRLMGYLGKQKIIPKNQFGFIPKKNTSHAVAHFTNKVLDCWEKHKKCAGIFLDVQKAFDSVNHAKLINKMEMFGIRGLALQLFKSYLSNRMQRVRSTKMSGFRKVLAGVPQGSVLGPILFILYIADLCDLSSLERYISCFADDTAILIYAENWQELKNNIEDFLNNIIIPWFGKNGLSLNANKTLIVPFSLKITKEIIETLSKIKLHTHSCKANACSCPKINLALEAKYLGILLDSSLSWRGHVNMVVRELRKITYSITELKNYLKIDNLRLVYISLFQSVLSYGLSVFGGAGSSILTPLVRAQRRIIKSILNLPQLYPSSEINELLNVPTLNQLYKYELLKILPTFIDQLLHIFSQNNYQTRAAKVSKYTVKKPFFSLEASKRGVFVNILDLFNELPEEYRFFFLSGGSMGDLSPHCLTNLKDFVFNLGLL